MLDVKNIHLIGIGGAGMTSLANILVEAGYNVSGSDIKTFSKSKELEKKGVKIYIGHSASNIDNSDLVVFSSAIPESNIEIIEARKRGIPSFHRMDMITLLFREKDIIGVAGTHGKTTTTSMISKMLIDNKIDASFYVGGESKDVPFGSHFGKDRYLVLETDEHDLSFLKITPYIPVVLNVDRDHLSMDGPFKGSFSLLKDAFKRFMESSSSHKVILNLDDDFLKDYSKTAKTEVLSFSLKDRNATLFAKNIEINGLNTSCDIFLNGKNVGRLKLKIPGEKNILNAMASFLVGYQLNLQPEEILLSLSEFKGTKRRFEILYDEKFTIIDDHADHPTEIEVTLKTTKEVFKDRREIEVDSFRGLLVDYLRKKNVYIVIRGLRAVSDFEYEFQMALINRKLNPEIETIFMMPKEEFFYISSSLVKEIAELKGNLSYFVPEIVEKKLREKFS